MLSQHTVSAEDRYYLETGLSLVEQFNRFLQAIGQAPDFALHMCVASTPAACYFSGLSVSEDGIVYQIPFVQILEDFKIQASLHDYRLALAMLNLNSEISAYFKTDFQDPKITVQRFIECLELFVPELIEQLWKDTHLHDAINQSSIECITELCEIGAAKINDVILDVKTDVNFLPRVLEKISTQKLEQIMVLSGISDTLRGMIFHHLTTELHPSMTPNTIIFSPVKPIEKTNVEVVKEYPANSYDDNNHNSYINNLSMQANMKFFPKNNDQNIVDPASNNLRSSTSPDNAFILIIQMKLANLLAEHLDQARLFGKKSIVPLTAEINSLLNNLKKVGTNFNWITSTRVNDFFQIDHDGYENWKLNLHQVDSYAPFRKPTK